MNDNRKTKPCGRVAEELLTAAAVAPQEVPGQVAEHLARCPECRAAVDELAADLALLSRTAARFTPALFRPVRAPAREPARIYRFAPRPAFAMALAAVLVLFFAAAWLAGPRPGSGPGKGLTAFVPTRDSVLYEDALFADNNALPPAYLEIAGVEDPGLDEDSSVDGDIDGENELWPDLDPMPGLSRAFVVKGESPC